MMDVYVWVCLWGVAGGGGMCDTGIELCGTLSHDIPFSVGLQLSVILMWYRR